MEGVNCDSIGILPDHGRESLAHIACGILGERQTEDIRGEIVRREEDIGYSRREELCLATSRPCYHEDGSVDALDCFELAIIERGEDRFKIHRVLSNFYYSIDSRNFTNKKIPRMGI